jgi:chromosome segregation ATPase
MRDYVAEDQGSGNSPAGQGVSKIIVHQDTAVTEKLAGILRPQQAEDTAKKGLTGIFRAYLKTRGLLEQSQVEIQAIKGELLAANKEIARLNGELKDAEEALDVAESDLRHYGSDEYWDEREADRLDGRLEEADGLPLEIGSLKYVLDVACTAYGNGRPADALRQLEKALLILETDIADASYPRATDNVASTITRTYNDVQKRADINRIIGLVSKGLEVKWETYGIEILPLDD